jgi:membrane protease YdiL (CAAX protease family)
MILFALCSHQGMPWIIAGAGGLLLTAAAIAGGSQRSEVESQKFAAGPASVLGLDGFSITIAVFTLAGVGVGAGAGLLHRNALGIALQPAEGVEAFVIMACLIGATEELIYRGWLFGKARAFGWPAAVMIAAIAHASYKTALFAWPPAPVAVDLWGMAVWTAAGGIVLGLLRVFSGSLIPPLLAHAAFDFVVYRSVAHAPWWVW